MCFINILIYKLFLKHSLRNFIIYVFLKQKLKKKQSNPFPLSCFMSWSQLNSYPGEEQAIRLPFR